MKMNIPKEFQDKGGVYILRSTITSDSYIGETRSFKRRSISHNGSTFSGPKKLKNYLKKHGTKSMRMYLIEEISDEKLRKEREAMYIRELQPTLNTMLKLLTK